MMMRMMTNRKLFIFYIKVYFYDCRNKNKTNKNDNNRGIGKYSASQRKEKQDYTSDRYERGMNIDIDKMEWR
jgi:hypothetical protein